MRQGAQYYVMAGDHTTGPADELLPARLVTDWSASSDDVDRFPKDLTRMTPASSGAKPVTPDKLFESSECA
jgi:hypothetical protein